MRAPGREQGRQGPADNRWPPSHSSPHPARHIEHSGSHRGRAATPLIVIDASTALALVLVDEEPPEELTGTDLIGALAPTLWHYEFVHPELPAVLDVARSTGLSTYDSSYLALAKAREVPLSTRDRTLREAAVSLGLDVTG